MPSRWFAKHFACWSGREQKNHAAEKRTVTGGGDMSITRSSIKRFGGQSGHNNCAKDGLVKCCDKFCKNHCYLSMMRNDLKGCGGVRRSFNAKSGSGKLSGWIVLVAN